LKARAFSFSQIVNANQKDGGTPGNCGWLKDKFGLSWQVIPKQLDLCLNNPDPIKAQAAMTAMMGMSKLIVSELEAAVS